MKRHSSYHFLSIFLAVLLLSSSSGLFLDVHLCQGAFKRVNLFGNAKTCMEVSSCATQCGAHAIDGKQDHNNCCENKTLCFDFDYDGDAPLIDAITNQTNFFIEGSTQIFIETPLIIIENYNHLKYIPPLLTKDLFVFIQSFLL